MRRTLFSLALLAGPLLAAEPAQPQDLIVAQDASGEFSGWKSFHEGDGVRTGDVWRLADGVLSCQGRPKGYLYTEKQYTNFVLELDWRWPPGKKPGNGGVLVRITGKNQLWPKSLEAQINVPDAGDLWALAGFQLTGPAGRTKSLDHPQLGHLTNVKKTTNAENPPGQWNHYKIVLDGPTVILTINGQVVNQVTGCEVVPGHICLTAEGDAIQFRNVRLTPRD